MIHTSHWGLSFPPFANDNRAETFVPTRSASLAIARLRYSLGTGMGASALFGEPGVGKTRIVRLILAEFAAANWLTGYMPSPAGGARDILAALSPSTAKTVPERSTGLPELQHFIQRRNQTRQPVLLAVDDVQTARGPDFLETIRTLLNLDDNGIKAFSILLAGQPNMEKRLETASGFDTQLLVRAVLEPMTDEEAKFYILARLKAAGSHQGIFTKHAAERVATLAKGNPRQINRLCELAMVVAYGLEAEKIGPDIVDMAAADLDMIPSDDSAFLPWPHPAPKTEAEPKEEKDTEDILAALTANDSTK